MLRQGMRLRAAPGDHQLCARLQGSELAAAAAGAALLVATGSNCAAASTAPFSPRVKAPQIYVPPSPAPRRGFRIQGFTKNPKRSFGTRGISLVRPLSTALHSLTRRSPPGPLPVPC